jgi:hypothetical protein
VTRLPEPPYPEDDAEPPPAAGPVEPARAKDAAPAKDVAVTDVPVTDVPVTDVAPVGELVPVTRAVGRAAVAPTALAVPGVRGTPKGAGSAPATSWRKRTAAGLALTALAVGLPVVLAATRPTGPVTLPLPPGLATPITGGPSGVPVPPPGDPATPDPSGTGSGTDGGGTGTPGAGGTTGGTTAPGGVPVVPAAAAGPGGPATSAPVPAAPPLVAKPLTAAYETVARTGLLGVLGYQGRVTIRNPGQVPVSGWTVTISLPAGETVNGATGAAPSQHGTTVTFRPSGGTGTVPAGGSVSFTFSVGGLLAGDPTGCAIDGRSCI